MSFSAFSKEFTANMYTSVENQFITKYLPWADGDAVRAYLYGLYLCGCKDEFDAESAAKLLKISYPRLVEIFGFWEECGLIHILSREPLLLEYLPVSAAIGKPKPIKAEKYAEFNRELLRKLQKAGKDFKPFEMQKILSFLENEQMEQQAFLLVVEYCMKKDGEKFSFPHVMNKAKKLVSEQKFTYEQVEKELSHFNLHERELSEIFSLLGIFRKPQEGDFELFDKWLEGGMEYGAVAECAKFLKKGSLETLDLLVGELREKNVVSAGDAREYLLGRAELTKTVFAVGRRLGVKVQSPRAFVGEYAEKWSERGYDRESLLLVAGVCFKLRYGFAEMDALLDGLYRGGTVDRESVKNYCAARDKQFRLLQSIQAACGVINKTESALDMIATWQSWNFGERMILEAARRAAGASAPLPYMNKLLSEWKRMGIFSAEAIPERQSVSDSDSKKSAFKSEAAIAADKRTDREHHFALLRQRALSRAEAARRTADKSEEFRLADGEVKKGEIELARAEVFEKDAAGAVREKLENAKRRRKDALSALGLTEADLQPRYECPKCSDTGYLPDGRLCDCYRDEN